MSSTGRRSSNMQDSLDLMQFHDQYLYAGAANLPLQHHLLHHHHQQGFVLAKDHAPEFADPAAEAPSEQDLAASGSEGGGDDSAEQRNDGAEATARGEEEEEEEARGVRMIALLMECAVAVSVGNLSDANVILLELSQAASPYASSCGERLVAYFAKAMAARLVTTCLGVVSIPPPCPPSWPSVHAAFRAFHNVAPLARLAHLACNQAVLDAVHGRRLVHVVDLDAVPGGALQWLSLLPALAARPGGPPALLRLTGFGASAPALRDAGSQLAALARKLGLPFEFRAVTRRPGGDDHNGGAEQHVLMPRKRPGEAVAVHWTRHATYDDAAGDDDVLRLVRWMEPDVLTLVEPERSSGGHFLDRFVSALHHYSALFDAMGASRPARDDASRHLAEDGVLGREISSVLGVGGRERKVGCWKTEMLARHGFLRAGCGVGRAQMVAGACPAGLGYTVADDHHGTLRLGWKGTPLYAISTWTWCPTAHHAQR
ncbi:hypothetical protein QOZ80_5AG0369040 [Eleusine coracana subsp. coracana]|nr:hypothetical protein QOZ80_5AG0369040 [Eleusine coracana subsp. coracana]